MTQVTLLKRDEACEVTRKRLRADVDVQIVIFVGVKAAAIVRAVTLVHSRPWRRRACGAWKCRLRAHQAFFDIPECAQVLLQLVTFRCCEAGLQAVNVISQVIVDALALRHRVTSILVTR